MVKLGFINFICDVIGIKVGSVIDDKVCIGMIVILLDKCVVVVVDIRGGGFGICEIDVFDVICFVDELDVIVFFGGFVFGLDVVLGVIVELGVGGCGYCLFNLDLVVFIVLVVILFDLVNGGDKNW